MASEVETRKPPANPDALVQRRLADVCRRMRRLELLGTLALLAAVTLAYALAMGILDLATRDWPAAPGLRWAGFALYLCAAGAIVARLVVLQLRRVNPYYAARQLEQTVPEAHNSLINWLDLHDRQDVPAAFRKNLGAFAARQARDTDPERVLDRRRHWWLLGCCVALVLGLLVLLARDPRQFGTLMQRAFLPFRTAALASRTHITLLRPESGNIRVAPGQDIAFVAHVAGRVPDVNEPGAPTLHYRYQPHDDFVALPLQPDDRGNWALRLSGDVVRTGLWYKVTAGDAETPVYLVEVRSPPQAQQFEVAYQYRPYLVLERKTVVFPNQDEVFPRIVGHQGTEVELSVRTNRKLAKAAVELACAGAKKELSAEIAPTDPTAFRCRWVLEHSGHFRVAFTSTEGETNTDRTAAYDINVLEDTAPRVVLTAPAQDVSLPANGTLALAGRAEDDIGVRALTLRLQVAGDAKVPLASKPYLDGKDVRFPDGTYPDLLDYSDFIALDQLQTAAGMPLRATPGMVLEYWLEAVDSSDYPDKEGRVGKSLTYKIAIREPDPDAAKQQEQRKRAEERRQQQQKQQQENLAKQQQKKSEQNQQQPNQAPEDKKAQDELARLDKEKQQTEKQIEKVLQEQQEKQEQQQRDEQRGQGKGQDQRPPGEAKSGDMGGEGQAQKKDNPTQENPGTGKDQGKGEGAAGNSKGEGPQQAGPQNDGSKQEAGPKQEAPNAAQKNQPDAGKNEGKAASADKGSSKPSPAPQDAGQAKDQGAEGNKQPAAAKADGPKESAGDKSQQKGAERASNAPAAQAKNDPKGAGAEKNAGTKGNEKAPEKGAEGGTKAPSAQAKDDPKAGAEPGAGPESKDGGGGAGQGKAKGAEPDTAKADSKAGDTAGAKPSAQAKPAGAAPGQPQGQVKEAPAGQSEESGIAKGDPLPGGKTKEPTWDDIARLMDQMRQKEGLEGAAKELAEAGKNAKDAKMREAAREALAQAGRDPDTGAAKDGPEQPAGPPQAGKNAEKTGEPTTVGKGPGKTKEPATGKEPQDPNAPGGSSPGGKGTDDEVKADRANPDFASRGGNLQLEDLKKRVTPEVLKQAGLTEADWQRYLQQAQAYDDLLRQLKAPRSPSRVNELRGPGGNVPSRGPSAVRGPDQSASPLDAGQAQPPPELRDAQRRFSSKSR